MTHNSEIIIPITHICNQKNKVLWRWSSFHISFKPEVCARQGAVRGVPGVFVHKSAGLDVTGDSPLKPVEHLAESQQIFPPGVLQTKQS